MLDARGRLRRRSPAVLEQHTDEAGDPQFRRGDHQAGWARLHPTRGAIATFDNDGTLWAEQPLYVQGVFAFDRVKAMAPERPHWKDKEPFKTILSGDLKSAMASGEQGMLALVMITHAGMTNDAFDKVFPLEK